MKNTKSIYCILMLLIFCLPNVVQAKIDWNRVVYGGNFGVGITTNQSAVLLSPTVGYRFTDQLELGTGVIYQYYKINNSLLKYQSDNYGAKIFGNYLLSESILAHVEYEWLNLSTPTFDFVTNRYIGNTRQNIGSLFVGAGYRQVFGRKSVVDMMLLYNLTESPYSPYENPIIRIGFGIGI